MEGLHCTYESRKVNRSFVLVDHILFLGRLCIWLLGNHFRSEDVLLEEALLDKLLQVYFEGTAIDGPLSFAVVVGIVLLQPE